MYMSNQESESLKLIALVSNSCFSSVISSISEDDLWAQTIWLPMNTLILDEKRVVVEKDSVEVQDMYRSIGMEPILVPFRHAFPLGGAFHCWTCDVRRRGQLQSYF